MEWLILLPLLALPLGYWLLVIAAMRRPPLDDIAVGTRFRPPAGLDPLAAGLLLDSRLKPRFLAAALVDLQLRGIVSFTAGDDGRFNGLCLDRPVEQLSEADKIMVQAVFEDGQHVSLATAGDNALAARHALAALSEEQLQARGFLRRRDWRAAVVFVAGLAGTVAATVFLIGRVGILAGLGFGAPAVLLMQLAYVATSWRLPLTSAGERLVVELEGYRRYLAAVEDGRREWNEKEAGRLDEHAPYGLIFGLALEWSDRLQAVSGALVEEMGE